jgi:hypothetical protein
MDLDNPRTGGHRPVKETIRDVFDKLSDELRDILSDQDAVARAKKRLQGQLLEVLSDSVSCLVKFDLNSFVSGNCPRA